MQIFCRVFEWYLAFRSSRPKYEPPNGPVVSIIWLEKNTVKVRIVSKWKSNDLNRFQDQKQLYATYWYYHIQKATISCQSNTAEVKLFIFLSFKVFDISAGNHYTLKSNSM